MQHGWTPLLEPRSSRALEARDAAFTIADALRDPAPPETPAPSLHETALLFAYVALADPQDLSWVRRAETRLNLAIEHADDHIGRPGLAGGLCGLAWTVEHLASLLGADSNEDLNESTDEVLLRAIRQGWRNRPYGLVDGLVGCGIYFLERLPRDSAHEGLRLIVGILEERAEPLDGGIAWRTPAELLPVWQRKLHSNGYYNLGVAHGIPAILHLLGETAAAGIERDRCTHLLDRAMTWFLAQSRTSGARSCYGYWVDPPEPQHDSRLAWCYGDLGIAAVLLQISRRADRPAWRVAAADLMKACLRRAQTFEYAELCDPALCHGAMGISHIFHRIAQAEDDSDCRAAAIRWLERALSMRRTGAGIAGFSSLQFAPGRQAGVPYANPAFVDGAVGVALALLAATTGIAPAWDRMLVLSGRTS